MTLLEKQKIVKILLKLKNILSKNKKIDKLCMVAFIKNFSHEESKLIYSFMHEHPPSLNTLLLKENSSITYFWKSFEKEPRIAWLNFYIKYLQNEALYNSVKALKMLIIKYESITLKDIVNASKESKIVDFSTKQELTGFGSQKTCAICRAVYGECENCISHYLEHYFCNGCMCSSKLSKSYKRIENANTPRKLLYAYRERGRTLRNYLREFGIHF